MRPEVWSLDQLLRADLGRAVAWVTPSVRGVVEHTLPCALQPPLAPIPSGVQTLIVIGGGTLIDEAKLRVREHAAGVRLVAVPSLWGSGAEASPVVAVQRDGRKHIRMDPEFLPHARVIWPELARSVPAQRARHACGDCWAHALEGLLSPVATDTLRAELADLIRRMLSLGLSADPRWFEISALACAGQARSSVGLVHGIAHSLEGPLREARPDNGWGHAKLCSIFLWPVMRFNRQASERWRQLLAQRGLDPEAVLGVLRELFEAAAYAQALPLLRAHWAQVLRDPCSRTNCALVRAGHLSFFETLEGE